MDVLEMCAVNTHQGFKSGASINEKETDHTSSLLNFFVTYSVLQECVT